jgi:hypothetical protein
MPPRETNVVSENIPQGHTINIGDLGQHKAIEQVAENDITKDAIELEAFMNEPVTIIVHQAVEEGQLSVQTPNVNGINQPIIRGQEVTVRRKYVEALARCRTTKYTQNIDQRDLSNIQMVEQTVVSYPFSIIKDTAKGAAWIKKILAER